MCTGKLTMRRRKMNEQVSDIVAGQSDRAGAQDGGFAVEPVIPDDDSQQKSQHANSTMM